MEQQPAQDPSCPLGFLIWEDVGSHPCALSHGFPAALCPQRVTVPSGAAQTHGWERKDAVKRKSRNVCGKALPQVLI